MHKILKLDYELFKVLNGFSGRSVSLDKVILFFSHQAAYIMVFLAACYGIYFWRDAGVKYALAGSVGTYIVSRLVLEVCRFAFYRQRPFLAHHVVELFDKRPENSFPSGHTSGMASIGFWIYAISPEIGLSLIFFSLLVGFARVMAGVHYPGDILGGFLFGIFAGVLAKQLF